jgi:putative flippase GtrA
MFPEGSASRRAETTAGNAPRLLESEARPAPRRIVARLRSLWQIRFLRFLLIAALNTVFGYALFAVLILLGIRYPLAAAIGTIVGILFNFQTTGRFVFESHDLSLILRFFGVYAITYAVGVTLLWLGERQGVPVLATAAVCAVPMGFLAYTLQRVFVFRARA